MSTKKSIILGITVFLVLFVGEISYFFFYPTDNNYKVPIWLPPEDQQTTNDNFLYEWLASGGDSKEYDQLRHFVGDEIIDRVWVGVVEENFIGPCGEVPKQLLYVVKTADGSYTSFGLTISRIEEITLGLLSSVRRVIVHEELSIDHKLSVLIVEYEYATIPDATWFSLNIFLSVLIGILAYLIASPTIIQKEKSVSNRA